MYGDASSGAAGGYLHYAEAYGKVVPTPDKKASLDAFVKAARDLGALWSDPKPTTPDAFSETHNKLTEVFLAESAKLQVQCPLPTGVTTTIPTTMRAQGRLYAVARDDDGQGLLWYSSFGCPDGKRFRLGPDMEPVEGEPLVGAVEDAEAGPADPFSGVVANASYDRIDDKITAATCV